MAGKPEWSNRIWQTTFSKNIHLFDSDPCHQLESGCVVPNEPDRWMWTHQGTTSSGNLKVSYRVPGPRAVDGFAVPSSCFSAFPPLLWVVRLVGCHLFWHNSWLSHEGLITYLVQKCCQLTADGIAVNSFSMRGIVSYTRRCLDSVFMFGEGLFREQKAYLWRHLNFAVWQSLFDGLENMDTLLLLLQELFYGNTSKKKV